LYFLKKDSADGRLLIWRCSWEMIKENPVKGLGYGQGGFKAHYMNYQAKYFEAHPDSKQAMLADNVNRPFNEYLLLLVNYGLFGLLVFILFLYRLWADYDLQMLMADNYKELHQYDEAECYYIKASNMCPVKFMSLHQLVEVYNETGHKEEALALTRKIVDKEIKISSSTVSAIKHKMQQLESGGSPAPESRKSDESINKQQPGQENFLEPQTPKELLPP
jgi:tetratricopeptide (TPR) repeat protein